MLRRISYTLAALLFISTAACSKSSAAETDATRQRTSDGLRDRDPQLAKKLVGEGALLLDVRSQSEWDDGHLDGAMLVPVHQLSQRLDEVAAKQGGDKDKPIVVYCRSGARAGTAKQLLLDAGYTKVSNLGGLTDWPND